MKTKIGILVTIVLIILNLTFILLVDIFTIKMLPGRAISGNGNLAIILWFIEIPAYILLLSSMFYLVQREKYFANRTIIFPICFFVIFVAAIILQFDYANDINLSIAHLIDEYGAINQYTNTIYINYYTFLIGISFLLTVQSLWQASLKKRTARVK